MTALGEKFSIVPIEAISDPELTPSEFKVLVALYSFRDKNADTSFPKLGSLATRAGFRDPTQVSKLTTRLEAKGWLTKNQKMGFHGPKKYRLTIPDRLLQAGEGAQLGRIAQVGEVEQGESTNLEELPKLEKLPNTNLEETTNSQLGQNYQGYKNRPVRTDHLTDSDATASAPAGAHAVDNSLKSLGEDYRHPSHEQLLFNRGAQFLGQYGIPDDKARAFLGMCKRDWKIGPTLDALVTAILSRPSGDPKAFIRGVLANPAKPIENTWEPDATVVAELEGLGVPPNLIRRARETFITWFRSMEIYHTDWNRLFRDWVMRDWEDAEFQAFQYRRRLAESAGFAYEPTFREPA